MPEQVLEKIISGYLATAQPQYTFGWQGGEPSLMGADFFKKVTNLQEKYGKNGAIITNGFQTNATLINDDFAEHLAEYHFLIGISLDGPPEINDYYRKHPDGKGSHNKTLEGIEILKRHKAAMNALVVVNDQNIPHARKIYHYLKNLGFFFQQYIPCVEFDKNGSPKPFAITGKAWGEFLIRLFDEWIKDNMGISIRLFDDIMAQLVSGQKNTCSMRKTCDAYFMVEHNGDVYPCDFFAEAQWKLGNIMENTWEELRHSSHYLSFARQKAKLHPDCANCPYLELCAGDCLKHRFRKGANPEDKSWLCEGWKMFYNRCLETFRKIARHIKMQSREELKPTPSQKRKVGPNDPCPCGSGLKFKRCCGSIKNGRGL